jgi:hypothetical protein
MLDNCPENERPIEELVELDFSELTDEELRRVRRYHEDAATQAPAPLDLMETLKAVFPEGNVVDLTELGEMPNGNVEVLDYTGEIDGGGIKMSMYDNYVDKPPMELVPPALMLGCARVLGYGAKKYAPNNWRRGMRWGEVFGALQRHLAAWIADENFDQESGLSHLDHAAACLSFLMHMEANEGYASMDDRV